MKQKAKPQLRSKPRNPLRSADVPVTAKMLYGVRDELIKRIDQQSHSFKSEVHGLKSEVHGLKAEIHGVKSEIQGVKAEVQGVKAEVHRLAVLIEEQNARNIIVLDGLTGLFDRQDRIEKQMSQRS